MTGRIDDRLPPWLEFVVPGESVEGIWRGVAQSRQGRPQAHVEVTDGVRAIALTTYLARQVDGLQPGQLVRVTYDGPAVSAAGREYRKLRIEPLIADELPDRPAPAPTAPAGAPAEQTCLPW